MWSDQNIKKKFRHKKSHTSRLNFGMALGMERGLTLGLRVVHVNSRGIVDGEELLGVNGCLQICLVKKDLAKFSQVFVAGWSKSTP